MLWTDEKLFTVQAIHNTQNDRFYAQQKEDILVNEQIANQCQKPASVMVWAGVISTGEKIPLIVIEEGVKINQHIYLKLIKEQLILCINRKLKETGITFQQDQATSHSANIVQEWCNDNIAGFWGKNLWPPSSPGLNPMDLAILKSNFLSILGSNPCSFSHRSVTSLKAKLRHCWAKISPETIWI